MDTTFDAQIADYGDGRTHVQVKNVPSQFKGAYRRSYGGAFNTENEELAEALADRSNDLTAKSLAGTSRRYLPVTVEIREEGGLDIVLPEVKSVTSKLFGAVSKLFGSQNDDPCACGDEDVIYISEDEIL